jgi:hypothetical protein
MRYPRIVRKAPTSPTAESMIQKVCVLMSQRIISASSVLRYQHVPLIAFHLPERESKRAGSPEIRGIRGYVPKLARCVWHDIADETDERGPKNVVFLHLLAVDVVREH